MACGNIEHNYASWLFESTKVSTGSWPVLCTLSDSNQKGLSWNRVSAQILRSNFMVMNSDDGIVHDKDNYAHSKSRGPASLSVFPSFSLSACRKLSPARSQSQSPFESQLANIRFIFPPPLFEPAQRGH